MRQTDEICKACNELLGKEQCKQSECFIHIICLKILSDGLRSKGQRLKADMPKRVELDSKCEKCACLMISTDNYCPNCGAKMEDGV